MDLLARGNLKALLDRVQPATVFDCVAYGAYSFEQDIERMYQTNVVFKQELVEELLRAARIATSTPAARPNTARAPPARMKARLPRRTATTPSPRTRPQASFISADTIVGCAARICACTRCTGRSRTDRGFIPTLVAHGAERRLPPFVDPETSRDFVYVDDAVRAFLCAAVLLRPEHYGASFNVGSGRKTTIRELAHLAKQEFAVESEPEFSTMAGRSWDLTDWYANPARAAAVIGWRAEVTLEEGLRRTAQWYAGLADVSIYERASKKRALDSIYSVSAIIACYKDGQAIPVMAERLERMFTKLNIDYEIIFVNDGSPDDSEETIRRLSASNPRMLGVTHSRNFGSQAAFRSGMEIAAKNAVVLMDGDLQDPPELIPEFIAKWREGFDVVYGERVKREAVWYMQIAYKAFYRIFDYFSSVPILTMPAISRSSIAGWYGGC